MGTYRLSKALVMELIHTLTPFMKIPNLISGLHIQRKIYKNYVINHCHYLLIINCQITPII